MKRTTIVITLCTSLLLAGCGVFSNISNLIGKDSVYSSRSKKTTRSYSTKTPEAELGSYGEKTNPYTVMGKRYYPLKSAQGYDEIGTASWYGAENHGMQTASGSIYNMYSMSAAHKTLPLGTIVRVTNLENHRVIDLLINDRGPFVGDRIIDLSYGAAKLMGFADSGLAQVQVTAIGTHPKILAQKAQKRSPLGRKNTASSEQGYYVQVGAFAILPNARAVVNDLKSKGYSGSRIETRNRANQVLYLVQAGTFSSRTQADVAQEKLKRAYPACFIASL